eukprot:s3506_g2.t1
MKKLGFFFAVATLFAALRQKFPAIKGFTSELWEGSIWIEATFVAQNNLAGHANTSQDPRPISAQKIKSTCGRDESEEVATASGS